MNRGSLADPDAPSGPLLASMRPRFMNRGSGRRKVRTLRGHAGFNEAPIHESGKSPMRS